MAPFLNTKFAMKENGLFMCLNQSEVADEAHTTIAKSRKVPLIIVRDDRKGSLRLGELVKLKTTISIGVKARGSAINRIMEGILDGDELNQGAVLQV
ncbi:Pectin lyase-like superfamily protein isoform 1 [Hibiscus syriacus]|uniref:Pectin lyase-like superfamily protein isoform 1 n=1 Tax=Hibiscus syriacus TaxID=106335 RepID=A0A6A2YQK3_HIBSY|nr:Pectin lyase-like superfamily protein isoform 1 [Hibiscus syriacus]